MNPHSSQPLSIVRNGNSPPQLVQVQPPPWASGQGDDFDLRRILAIARRRSIVVLGVAAVVVGFTAVSVFHQESSYESRFRLLVEPVNANPNVTALAAPTSDTSTSIYDEGLDYDTQIQVLQSPDLMKNVVRQLQKRYPDVSYSLLMGSLTVTRLNETKIIEVRYQDGDPTKVKIVLDQVADAYLQYSLLEKQTSLRQGLQFVETQLPALQDRVNQLQIELQTFRQSNNFIDPTAQASQISSQASSLDQQQLALGQQLAQARSRFDALQGETGAVAALKDATLYQQLLGQLQDVDSQIAAELTRFQAQNPAIQALQQQRSNLVPLLQKEAQRVVGERLADVATQIQVLEVQSQATTQAQQQLNNTLQQLPLLSRRYVDLQRDLEAATASLSRFQATRETLQINVSQKEIPWQLIAPPASPNPTSESATRSLALGGMAGLFLGIAVAMLLEKLNTTYHNADELKGMNLPLLGLIPLQKEPWRQNGSFLKSPDTVRLINRFPKSIASLLERPFAQRIGYSSSEFQEALQILYTNLQQIRTTRSLRALTLSSAESGDGKTTIAIALAQTVAAMGQRVLLIDADLRCPQIHDRLKLSNQKGLSTYLTTNLPMRNFLQQPSPAQQFYVLTAGEPLDNPTMLLSSPKMQQLMTKLINTFDWVICDAPPVLGFADVSVLTPQTEGLLLIVRLGKTDRSAVVQTLDSMKLAQFPVLGYVVNQGTEG